MNSRRIFSSELLLIRFLFSIAVLPFVISYPSFAQIEVQVAFPNLSFVRPVDLQHAGDGTDRLFMVEQSGVISVFENASSVTAKNVFLDIQDRVRDIGNEEGLLGLAFHPGYEENGYFYVNYTASNPRRTVITRYTVNAANPDAADKNSEMVILEIDQPFGNHNGGPLRFGPDGYLYIGMGDGGASGDPFGHGQNLKTLLGALLRIDVDTIVDGQSYGIPPDNPFVGNPFGYQEEIYAYGLRNPWRFSFDTATNWLWLADVGQNAYEEIDIIESGKNYGWNVTEGLHCFNPSFGCDTTGLELPGFFKTARFGVEDNLTLFSRQTPPIGGKSAEKSCDSVAFATADTCGLNPPSRWFPSQSPTAQRGSDPVVCHGQRVRYCVLSPTTTGIPDSLVF